MRSTFHSLEVAKRGLYAQQTAISTTGHNISNANTKGYSRQRVNFTASTPIEAPGMNRSVAPGQLGTGVSYDSIKRVRESFLDDQFRNEAQSHGNWSVQKDTLEKLELIFNEPSDQGLRSVIDQFWNGWQDLSREPDNLTARAVVKERSLAMMDAFKHTDTKLSELSEDLTTSIDIKVGEANNYVRQIAQLNEEIRRIEGLGDNANDLRDQRDVLTDELSKIVDISVKEAVNGMYNVSLADGTALVEGLQANQLGDAVGVDQVTGGEIAGLVKARDTIVAEYQTHLNTMLKGLIYGEVKVDIPEGSVLPIDVEYGPEDNRQTLTAGDPAPDGGITVEVKGINGLHQLGWTLRENADGNAIEGAPFFIPDDEGSFTIQSTELNPDIVKDVGMIAASLRIENVDGEEKVLRGNGGLALAMGQLRDGVFSFNSESKIATAGPGTFDEYFRSVVGGLGVKTQEASRQTSNQATIMNSVENRRQSVSGVSLDEEMANLIKFQHAYNASARTITTADQMLDTIINRMGVVGR
jgi:flagellar hook-associated protein 1 FlgK